MFGFLRDYGITPSEFREMRSKDLVWLRTIDRAKRDKRKQMQEVNKQLGGNKAW